MTYLKNNRRVQSCKIKQSAAVVVTFAAGAAMAWTLPRFGGAIARADSVTATTARVHPLSAPPATAPTTAPAPVAKAAAQAANPANGPMHVVRINGRMIAGGPLNANNVDEMQRQMIRNEETRFKQMKGIGPYKLSDFLHITLVDGELQAAVCRDAVTHSQGMQRKLDIPDSSATWALVAQPGGAMAANFIFLQRMDFTQVGDDQVWQTAINVYPNNVQFRESGVKLMVILQQSGNTVSLNVMRRKGRGGMEQIASCSAQSIMQMQEQNPGAVEKYVLPMLQRLGAADVLSPGAGDVYSAFTEIPADPKVTQSIDQLLPHLGADAYRERTAASRELAKLGAAGVLAAVRMNLAPLTAEQKARIEFFVLSSRRRLLEDPSSLARDPEFLIECLQNDDPAVRIAARHRLELVLKHPIDFDVAMPEQQRQSAVDKLRLQLAPELKALAPNASGNSDDNSDDDDASDADEKADQKQNQSVSRKPEHAQANAQPNGANAHPAAQQLPVPVGRRAFSSAGLGAQTLVPAQAPTTQHAAEAK